MAFSPDGRDLATPCGDGLLRVWNLDGVTVRRSAPIEETSCEYDDAYLGPDRLVFAGTDLRWWDVTADGWNPIAPRFSWSRRIRVSPDGRYLAEVDQTRSTDWSAGPGLVVLGTDDWQPFPVMEDCDNTTGGVAFSPDGRWLASGHMVAVGHRLWHVGNLPGGYEVNFHVNDYDYLVHLRQLPTGRIDRTIGGWQQAVTHLTFTPDGTLLAGTAGPRPWVWDLTANREIAVHKRGTKHFQGLSFDAGGRFLATVSNDETVRIWDARPWLEHTSHTWNVGRLLNIAFAPGGHW